MLLFDQLRKGEAPLRTLALLVAAGLLVLLTGLWHVQVISGPAYRDSQQSQAFRTVRRPAVRGTIRDRNNLELASVRAVYSINAYLESISPRFEKRYYELKREFRTRHPDARLTRMISRALEEEARYQVLSNLVFQVSSTVRDPYVLDPAAFKTHYRDQLSLPLEILEDLSHPEVARFMEQGQDFPGVGLAFEHARIYPYASAAAHVLGHLSWDWAEDETRDGLYTYALPFLRGQTGIEATFDPYLIGQPGMDAILVNNYHYRQREETWIPPTPGRHVVLTLDLRLQQAAEEALASNGPGTKGAAVVLDVRTGDLLALASSPTFDPNMFVEGFSQEVADELYDIDLKPTFNRATHGAYMPGSIFKIVVGLAGLESGQIDPAEKIYNPGYYQIEGSGRPGRFGDEAAPGFYDFETAFKRSSNTYFIHHGLRMGPEAIVRMAERFLLGRRTGIPTNQETSGHLPSRERLAGDWFLGQTANLSIGQGEITVTPLQTAILVAAVANGGLVLKPRLVARVEPADPDKPEDRLAFPARQIVSELRVRAEHLDLIRDAMRADVRDADGTGFRAEVPGLEVCAKTGTAEVKRGGRLEKKTTWFASYCDHRNPRYAVVVMVDEGRSGGRTCAPVARRIYEAIRELEQGRNAFTLSPSGGARP